MKVLKIIIVVVFTLTVLGSCASFFEDTPDSMLTGDNNFTERSNIYASFMGLLGTLQDAMDEIIVLSELRGDLLMPTDQAPESYWEIYRYSESGTNEAADPAPLYFIVMNCNDFLRNTIEYNRNYPGVIPLNTYRQLIAGAVTLRAWTYLQIGKLYGKAVYYDYAMMGEVDLSKLPVLWFDDLIPELLHFMNTGVDNINGLRRVDIDTMFDVEGLVWRRMAIAPDALMCELYLWNKQYEAAAKRGINLISGQGVLEGIDANNLTCSYQFGSLKNGFKPWYTLWSEAPVQVHTNEGMTIVHFDYTQRQINPLHELFSATPPNLYHLKPTENLISKFVGRDYLSGSVMQVDPRGLDVTYGVEMGQSVVYKYHNNERLPNAQDAPIYVYRAAEIHLMIMEALSAMGNLNAADSILNVGFKDAWVNGNIFKSPFDAPIYAQEKLKGGVGIRGRLDIPKVYSGASRFTPGLTPGTEFHDNRRRLVLDSLIIEETARELAFEGKRWFTLMRIARNSNNPEMLAKMTSRKFPEGEREAYEQLLLDPKNWFIKYNLKLNN